LVRLQGDFHFSIGTIIKRSEQPQGDFFALQRVAIQPEVMILLEVVNEFFLFSISAQPLGQLGSMIPSMFL
jgi:hypothetical protein